jgi:hypothetical protein
MTKEGMVALDADRAHHPCGYVRAGQRVLALAAFSQLLGTRSRYAR